MKRHTLSAALLALALLGGSSNAGATDAARAAETQAQPARLHLEYERGPGATGCLGPGELARLVEQRLGRAAFVSAADAEIQARVRAQRAGRGFAIEVELRDRDARVLGRRRLSTRARHCSALDDALTLVVSLAVDVSAAPVLVEPAAVPPLATLSEVPADTFAPRLGWSARAGLGVALASGLLPGAGAGPAIELGLRAPELGSLWLRATSWHGQRVGSGAAGAAFSAQSLELGVCPWTLHWGSIEFCPCAEQLLGRVHARGFGFDLDQSGASASLALGALGTLSLRSGAWFISASGSLLAPVIQRRYFYLDGQEVTLHDQAWVWGLGGLSLGLQW